MKLAWDPFTAKANRVNIYSLNFIYCSVGIATDLVILLLPVRVVLRLQMGRKRGGTFGCALFLRDPLCGKRTGAKLAMLRNLLCCGFFFVFCFLRFFSSGRRGVSTFGVKLRLFVIDSTEPFLQRLVQSVAAERRVVFACMVFRPWWLPHCL